MDLKQFDNFSEFVNQQQESCYGVAAFADAVA